MNKKYVIRLSKEEQEMAHRIAEDKTTSKTYKRRANILLMVDESKGKIAKQEEIAARCGVSTVTVYHTLRDYCEQGIEYALKFKTPAQPSKKPIVTGEREARIIALACGEAPDGCARWTVRLLTEKVVELEILPHGSRETIRRTLKKLNLSLI